MIVAGRSSVRLNPAAFTTDVARFEASHQSATRAAPGEEAYAAACAAGQAMTLEQAIAESTDAADRA